MPNDRHDVIPELERFVRTGQAAQRAVDTALEQAQFFPGDLTEYQHEAALLARVAGELEIIRAPLALDLHPSNVLQLAGLIQLALRHPSVTDTLRGTADRFLTHARDYFAEAPAVLELLARGDQPRE